MKRAMFCIEGIVLLVLLFTQYHPEEILPIEKISTVNFSQPSGILDENNSEGIWVRLHLSREAFEDGEVSIKQINRGEFNPFVTDPGISDNGIIKIPVVKGSSEIMYKVIPCNDELTIGHQEIIFRIDALSGKLATGSLDAFTLEILDDDLSMKLKSYETESTTRYYRQEFSYNERGKVRQILFATSKNPSHLGQYMYTYNEQGLLFQINSDPALETQIFSYAAGKLVKNEKPSNTEIMEFETYGFGTNDLLESITYKKRYGNGNEELVGYKTFTYFPNGNVESMEHYTYTSPAEVKLDQRISYSDYSVFDNPLPFFNNIPDLLYQPKLPGKIIHEEDGQIYTYRMDYAFNSNGKVSQRTLKGIGGDEVTKYFYY